MSMMEDGQLCDDGGDNGAIVFRIVGDQKTQKKGRTNGLTKS